MQMDKVFSHGSHANFKLKARACQKSPKKPEFHDFRWLKKGYRVIVGIDEAGRGALAGPLSITALTLLYVPFSFLYPPFVNEVRDSKELTPQKRQKLYLLIENSPYVLYSNVFISNKTIDNKGISWAFEKGTLMALKALSKQLAGLGLKPELVIIDGNRGAGGLLRQESIIKADRKYLVCALASIVSKVKRDNFMRKLHLLYPFYGFSKHKGYGTPQHLKSIKKTGLSPWHRKTFLDT